ncbi:MAG: hypothetical protein RLZ83_247 [Pseudomonadota bacterium]|jgi:type 1 glutamine amidotransferase
MMSAPARAIQLAGGLHHPVQASAAFWDALWQDVGVQTHTFEDIDAGCRALAAQSHDLLVVSALRWPMDHDEKYAPHRQRWAYRVSEQARLAIEGHLERGGALLAMHTACISFGDWPGWRNILGARWVWGQSSHLPHGLTYTRIDRHDHPIMAGVDDFEAQDEVYGQLEMLPTCEILAHSHAADGAWKPTWWTHRHEGAAVCVDLLGHDEGSLRVPAHGRALRQAVDWLLTRAQASGRT